MKLVMTPKQFQTILILFFTNKASDLVSELPSASNIFQLDQTFYEIFTVLETPKIIPSISKKSMKILFLKN